MGTYTQANRAMKVTTPLGPDTLLLVGFTGHEGLSQLFHYQLDLLAENSKEVAFDKLLGQPVSVSLALPGGKARSFAGICSRFSQGARDTTFTAYRLEMVPALWLLTHSAQSRIFQQLAVPDILKKVLTGLDVSWEITGTFEKRDYCVQYRETDFNFASRLMEEEGLYYFFKHEGGHKMVVANTPQSHPDMPQASKLIFDVETGGNRPEDRVYSWEKVQELRAGKVTLWDHTFEKPHKHLEAEKTILESIAAGKVTHKQALGTNAKLELYDYPGEYAQRFDGVNKGGGDQPTEVEKIFQDNKRTVGIRMQQDAVPGLVVHGSSTCRQMVAGHKFTLERHFNADGAYVLTGVQHAANLSMDYRTDGAGGDYQYQNSFTCIPLAQPYRPQRTTPKPFVQGTQTAVVVGPPGEEIFTDKYGRIKVQFHWDRDGKNNAESSCWVRVAQPWAGKRWGAFFWPRIGQEVIVDFLEGDPDQPIIVGSVYNADQMPPYLGKGPDSKHPNDNKLTGVKSNTTKGGQGFNEWRFDDTKDKQQVFVHAEKDMDERVKNDSREIVLHNRHLVVGGSSKDGNKQGDQREQVYQDKHLTVQRHHLEDIQGNMQLHVGGTQDILIDKDKKETVGGDHHHHAKKNRNEKVDQTQSLTVGQNQYEKVGQNHALDAGMQIHLKAGMTLILEAGMQISLKVGGNFIDIGPSGISIQGTMVMINSGGAAGSGSGSSPTAPQDAQQAKPTKPDEADDAVTGQKSAP
jgi:type VI secretion system secreted protein VgrG